ncbi:MAG: deoxyribonuclease V [Micavibrio aeruginosavorus]|uniref:Endonuclease V n=1 Tax=Micavibrio aeruginosavorus TaxID=349221 RepID=A0A2W5HNU3_9BACT|nr:MAG: deoxyribonuclease V [Micavibrio aeruginosavorus]
MLGNIEWADTPEDAMALQNKLREHVSLHNDFKDVKIICGVDCSYDLQTNMSRAVLCAFSYPELDLLESAMAHLPTIFPYVPGLLSFREIPVILEAFKVTSIKPDLLMVDGMGIAHPRRMGIATHLGLCLDIPAIGVGKSLLCGRYDMPGSLKGNQSPLIHKKEIIGTVLRTKDNINPLFISPGHKIDHETAVQMVLNCVRKYKLPEPTHTADKFSKIRPVKTLPAQRNLI